MTVTLYGYSYSVYLRIVRMMMLEKGVAWAHIEVDPFTDPIPPEYLALNPFGRVPTLDHDGFVLYETTAITRYIDEAFGGPSLQPEAPPQRARMNQIIAIADSYGYWPMVRQVFSQRVFNARRRTPDEAVVAAVRGIVDGEPRLDLEYTEDSAAEVDMNVVMTGDGLLIEVQATAEQVPFSRPELDTMLELAAGGIEEIGALQRDALETLVA
jgi:hypothetical protein